MNEIGPDSDPGPMPITGTDTTALEPDEAVLDGDET